MSKIKMQDWIEGARKRFGFDTWPRPSEKNAQLSARHVSLDAGKMAETWHRETRIPWGDTGYADYFESVKNNRHRIMVRVSEYRSHDDARMALLKEVSVSSAVTLPRLDARGIPIGDVGFTGHGDMDTGIIFVRNNILVDVRSIGEEPVSVAEFAKVMDNYITSIVE